MTGKLVILSAPSGAGKTTIMKRVVERFPQLEFSISATTRAPRGEERDGADYYFMTADMFRAAIGNDEFVEWEEVYDGVYYGTLRAEVERIWVEGKTIIFDVDVRGGINLKQRFGDRALSVFIMPPSVETLRERLVLRDTDPAEAIERRVAKAEQEIARAGEFDVVVVNDVLEDAIRGAEGAIGRFLDA